MTMRDAFFHSIVNRASMGNKLVIVTADMSAPALDDFRTNYPHRYINVGIAEQSMILTACGLANEGFIPVCYAIQPFASLRCYEQIKVIAALMNIPIMIVGVGAGFSYEDSGPTHHALEDLAIMRILPNMTVWNPSSNHLAVRIADEVGKGLMYVRLDRKDLPEIYPKPNDLNFDSISHFADGFDVSKWSGCHQWIVSTGNMVHTALEVTKETDVGVIDVFKFPFDESKFRNVIGDEDFVIVEENNSRGGLAAAVYEALNKKHRGVPSYDYVYGGRGNIQKFYGLDKEGITKWLSD